MTLVAWSQGAPQSHTIQQLTWEVYLGGGAETAYEQEQKERGGGGA